MSRFPDYRYDEEDRERDYETMKRAFKDARRESPGLLDNPQPETFPEWVGYVLGWLFLIGVMAMVMK
jgi:hypothetical protein